MKYLLVFTILLLGRHTNLLGQDKIYFSNKVIEGKVLQIEKEKVKYKDYKKNAIIWVNKNEILFAFNKNGSYLVINKLDDHLPDAEALTTAFLSDNQSSVYNNDIAINKKRHKIAGTIEHLYDSALTIVVKNNRINLATKNLVAVLFKSGEHAIFDDFEAAAAMLWLFQREFLPVGSTNVGSVAIGHDKNASSNVDLVNKTKKEIKINQPRGAKYSSVLYEKDQKPVITEGEKPYKPLVEKKTYSDLAGGVPFPEFEKKAIEKVQQLSNYIKILCDKKVDYIESNKAIEQALTLFVDENVVVEVSATGKSTITRLKIRDYLTKLKLVKYEKVEIEWTNIQYVSNFKKAPDGNYYGEVSFEQVFRGYKDGKMVYSDVTQKNAQVVLKSLNKQIEGKTFLVWDVLLSNIGVTVTK